MLSSDFKEFAALLNSNRAEYLVVGGYALAAHGQPRYTGDLDFWVGQLGYPPRRIDLMTSIDGVSFDPCFNRRVDIEIDGTLLHFISLEDFKTNKRASGRLKDLADLESLGEPPGRKT